MLAADVLVQRVADETVLLNLVSGLYYSLDEVGTVMLELATRLPTSAGVVAALLGEYEDVREATLSADLERLIDKLVAKGLVSRS